MQETELRFHVPAEHRERLRRRVDPRGQAARTPLAARYFDTPARQLAQAGIGLRLRREGSRWVQTCKGPTQDGLTRLEHNAVLPEDAPVALDLARHAGHPLAQALAGVDANALQARFCTDILRVHRAVRIPGGRLELAWDEGRLLSAGASLGVHELELELLDGPPGALLRHAHRLVVRWPLRLDVRSKAERGENLARGLRQSPPRLLPPLRLPPAPLPHALLRALLLNGFEPVAANASQIGSGAFEPGHERAMQAGLAALQLGLAAFLQLWPALQSGPLQRFARAAGQLAQGGAAAVAQPGSQQFLIEWLGWLELLGRRSDFLPALADTRPLARLHAELKRLAA